MDAGRGKPGGSPLLQHPECERWHPGTHARSGVTCADGHRPSTRTGAVLCGGRRSGTVHRCPHAARGRADARRVYGLFQARSVSAARWPRCIAAAHRSIGTVGPPMGREHPVIDKADLLIGTGWEQHKRHRHWPAALAMAVGPPACLAVPRVTLDGCPSRVPPCEAACHAHTGADHVWTHHRP
jgi:hypothetical protein